jgi:hypothetical protein
VTQSDPTILPVQSPGGGNCDIGIFVATPRRVSQLQIGVLTPRCLAIGILRKGERLWDNAGPSELATGLRFWGSSMAAIA